MCRHIPLTGSKRFDVPTSAERGSDIWVAQGSDRILGFVIAKVEAPFYAHIITLDVIPAARRRKVGTKLMNEVHHELENRNIGMVGLEVGVDNRKAQRLYGKLGYQRMGILSGYYRGREDAFRMVRRLKD